MSIWLSIASAILVLGLVQSLLLGLQTYEHRRYARGQLKSAAGAQPRGHTLLVVPCREAPAGLEANLHHFLDQDHPDFETLFVVGSELDPAHPVIRRMLAERSAPARLLVAGAASEGGQKVHNLLVATRNLPPGVDCLAFADSDIRPHRGWLRGLTATLEREQADVVTGYRWLAPQIDTHCSRLLSCLNARITMLLGKRGPTLIWGGSWAIRRHAFEACGIRAAWRGVLNDDLVAAAAVRRCGLRIQFTPLGMVNSPFAWGAEEMLLFLRRQYFQVRYYARPWWWLALAGSTLSLLAQWGGLAVGVGALVGGLPEAPLLAAVYGVFLAMELYRERLRRDVAKLYQGGDRPGTAPAKGCGLWAGLPLSLLHWLVILASTWGACITWAGIRYRVDTDGRCTRVPVGGSTGDR